MIKPEHLLQAYRQGFFPMAVGEREEICWYEPEDRGVIPLDERFHVPQRLARLLKKRPFEITFDADFPGVMRGCAERRKDGTWISQEIFESYLRLFELGHAHSVEVRVGGELAGGLYGVHIGAAFFGESMFHRVTNASKVALVAMVERLRSRGFELFDTQWLTEHLKQFGTYEVPRDEYLRMLSAAVSKLRRF